MLNNEILLQIKEFLTGLKIDRKKLQTTYQNLLYQKNGTSLIRKMKYSIDTNHAIDSKFKEELKKLIQEVQEYLLISDNVIIKYNDFIIDLSQEIQPLLENIKKRDNIIDNLEREIEHQSDDKIRELQRKLDEAIIINQKWVRYYEKSRGAKYEQKS